MKTGPKILKTAIEGMENPSPARLESQPQPQQLKMHNAKKSAQVKTSEALDYLRLRLYKMAEELGNDCRYSSEHIDRITSSSEAFEKAAKEEAELVWAGIEDTLRKEGADSDFIAGMKKEAMFRAVGRGIGAVGRGLAGAGRAIGRGAGAVASNVGRGLEHGIHGAILGGTFGGLPGAALGGMAGMAGGSMGYGRAGLLGAGALGGGAYLGTKALQNAFSDSGVDTTGLAANRNRAVPGLSNKASGGIGGALLGALISSELGMQGPQSWLMPVLGGLAGYNYLPQMMDKWKDPYGHGVNSISPGAAHMNRSISLL